MVRTCFSRFTLLLLLSVTAACNLNDNSIQGGIDTDSSSNPVGDPEGGLPSLSCSNLPANSNHLTFGSGSTSDPYLICNGQHFKSFAAETDTDLLTKSYRLENDIDLSTVTGFSSMTEFSGSLDGNNKTISNFSGTATAAGFGLINWLKNGGEIKNLNTDNFVIDGATYTAIGGLVGQVEQAVISNVHMTNVQVTNSVGYVGGLAGIFRGKLTNVSVAGTVTVPTQDVVGGVVGWFQPTADLSSSDNITANVVVQGQNSTGGVIGEIFSPVWDDTMTNVTNNGNVTGQDDVGGLVGRWRYFPLSNAINRGDVSGQNNVGGIVGITPVGIGYAENNDVMSQVVNEGIVMGQNNVGGIAGYLRCKLSDSYSTGNVSGDTQVGGLAGVNVLLVENSYSHGQVSATTSDLGGIVGVNSGSVRGSYTILPGGLPAIANVGGVIGDNSGVAEDNYYNSSNYAGGSCGTESGSGCGSTTALADAAMRLPGSYSGSHWNFMDVVDGPNDTWYSEAGEYPKVWWESPDPVASAGLAGDGTQTSPYLINNEAEMAMVGSNPLYMNAYLRLNSNITFVGEFPEIASTTRPFIGNFDGGGFTLTNLSITTNGTDDYRGMFRTVGEATIANFDIVNINISLATADYVGGIAGVTYDAAEINNIKILSGSIDAGVSVAGIVGKHDLAGGLLTLDELENHATVDGVGRVAGIVGYSHGYVVVTNSSNHGDITGTSDYVGGISGEDYTNTTNLTRCFNVGDIDGNDYVGGIAGELGGYAHQVYSDGAISGNNYVGGLAGQKTWNTEVTESFVKGSVSGSQFVGGLVGRAQVFSPSFTNNYNRANVTGATSGGIAGYSDFNINNFSFNYSTGTVTSGSNRGCAFGSYLEAAAPLDLNYYDSTVCSLDDAGAQGNLSNVEGQSTVNLKGSTMQSNGFDFTDVWTNDTTVINDGYPIFQWQVE